MAPRQVSAPRRTQSSQNEGQMYELGVQGRKTGVTLVDTGERDEYGMEPADNLFSSPEKPEKPNGAVNGHRGSPSEDEQDMEIDDESTLGPATVARMRNAKSRLSIPRARSPLKTSLNSPARHNARILPSPSRATAAPAGSASPSGQVKRRLDFTQGTNGNATEKNTASQGRKPNRLPSSEDEDEDFPRPERRKQQDVVQDESEEGEEEEEEEEDEESMQVLNVNHDEMDSPAEEEPEPEAEVDEEPDVEEAEEEAEEEEDEPPAAEVQQPKKRGRRPKSQDAHTSQAADAATGAGDAPEPAKKRAGRPPKSTAAAVAAAPKPVASSSKRPRPGRNASGEEGDQESGSAQERETKRPRKEKETPAPVVPAKTPATAPKGKQARKRKSSGVGAASPAVVPRPPMPKARGLQIMRREDVSDGILRTTRSGRISAKPLEFWKGERYEYDDDNEETIEDKGGRRIKLATIKGVVRVEPDQDEPKRKRPARPSRPGKPKRRSRVVEEDEEEEDRSDWEDQPGRITGECIYWYPQYEHEPPEGDEQVEVIEEELAISQAAIQMKDIKDATFRFAKTMTLPFFGSGLVDLPPHSEKKPKSARKMQMVFFVHYGTVQVTVAGTTFRIGKGGQWFVPRGNHYSIENNTGRPARLFFAQGCEVAAAESDGQEM